MQITRTAKQGRSAFFDVIEDFHSNFPTPGSTSDPRPIYVAGMADPAASVAMFDSVGGAALQYVTRAEGWARRFAAGSAQTCAAYSRFGFPLGRDLSVFPASIRNELQRRYVWDCVMSRAVALSATAQLFIGLRGDGTTVDLGDWSYGIQSLTSENAGAWTPKHNLTNGGGLVTGASTGVVPDGTPQYFRFEYYDVFPSPRLLCWINGVLRKTWSGAELPTITGANEPFNLLMISGSAAHVIGQQDHNNYNRFFIEKL